MADDEKWFGNLTDGTNLPSSSDTSPTGFSELWTAKWWENATENARRRCTQSAEAGVEPVQVLSIILYVDGINVDFFGNIQLIPVMVTLGNFSTKARQALEAKRVLGFIPHLSDEAIVSRTKVSTSTVRRELMHAAIDMYATNGFVAVLN